MTTRNDITGDKLQSRINNQAFEDNFEKIFGKKTKPVVGYPPLTPNKPLDSTEEWDEKRIDIISQNGNDGLHYEDL